MLPPPLQHAPVQKLPLKHAVTSGDHVPPALWQGILATPALQPKVASQQEPILGSCNCKNIVMVSAKSKFTFLVIEQNMQAG
jgi:hypothetical protein